MILEPPERHWVCPNCTTTSVTRRAEPHTQMHQCAGMGGLVAPMVADGQRVRVVAVERQDYVGGERGLRFVDGRPVMATEVRRGDGSYDTYVYPGVAVVEGAATNAGG